MLLLLVCSRERVHDQLSRTQAEISLPHEGLPLSPSLNFWVDIQSHQLLYGV